VGGLAILGLVAVGGLYYYFRTPAAAPAAATSETLGGAAVAPLPSMASGPVTSGSTSTTTAPQPAPAPVTTAPRGEAVEREAAEAPVTLPRRVPTPVPSPVAPVRTAATSSTLPPTTEPAHVAAPAPAVSALRLDVSAVQPAFGDAVESLAIEVRVDGETIRTLTLRFDGATRFARSRRRQAFEIQGVRVGERNVTVVVRADPGLSPVQASTRVDVREPAGTATLDVRLRGNGEGDATFR
jgi:hypothetical protein